MYFECNTLIHSHINADRYPEKYGPTSSVQYYYSDVHEYGECKSSSSWLLAGVICMRRVHAQATNGSWLRFYAVWGIPSDDDNHTLRSSGVLGQVFAKQVRIMKIHMHKMDGNKDNGLMNDPFENFYPRLSHLGL